MVSECTVGPLAVLLPRADAQALAMGSSNSNR